MMNRKSARPGRTFPQGFETEPPDPVRSHRAEKDGTGERPMAPHERDRAEKGRRQGCFEQLGRCAARPDARAVREANAPTSGATRATAVEQTAEARENRADENRDHRRVPEFSERQP